jgi:rubrerythrin
MSATTLDNLMAAFNGESNAHARYIAFAKKADEEGYGQVASLFRAASRAEEIHAANHAKAIEQMGDIPQATIESTIPKSTAENLKEAIAGETYEKDVMYPQFIEQATTENERNALRTFTYAMKAEIEHAALYQEALDHLADWKDGKKDFFVCPICGKTVTQIDAARCDVCLTPTTKFEKVS